MRLIGVLILFFVAAARAQTNGLSGAEMEGRALVQRILEQRPAADASDLGRFRVATNSGVLEVRDGNDQRSEFPVKCTTVVGPDYWEQIYDAELTNHVALVVIHSQAGTNLYFYQTNHTQQPMLLGDAPLLQLFGHHDELSGPELMTPFAGSDFWLGDLGMEFFHWPQQKILKKEFHRQCPCMVLESTNPDPGTNGYSRVVCWIDEDSLGIVEAYAYDANGRKLKNFYPKDFKKVKGQYQVQSLIMDNLQTGSRSRLEFDLEK